MKDKTYHYTNFQNYNGPILTRKILYMLKKWHNSFNERPEELDGCKKFSNKILDGMLKNKVFWFVIHHVNNFHKPKIKVVELLIKHGGSYEVAFSLGKIKKLNKKIGLLLLKKRYINEVIAYAEYFSYSIAEIQNIFKQYQKKEV